MDGVTCLSFGWGGCRFLRRPTPGMFIAQKAAQRCGRRLHFVMAGWFPGGDSDHSCYQDAAQCHAPDVPVHFLDGKNPEVVRCCWAAADLFLSLVDNPQETLVSRRWRRWRPACRWWLATDGTVTQERWSGLPGAYPGASPCQARGGPGPAA